MSTFKVIRSKKTYTLIHNNVTDVWLKKLDGDQFKVLLLFCYGKNSKEISEKLQWKEEKVLKIDKELSDLGVYKDIDME